MDVTQPSSFCEYFWPSPERTRFTCWIAPLPITMSTIGTATRSTGAKTTRAWPWSGALMPRMAAEAGCAAMAGTTAAIAAGTGPAETGATCVFGGASAAAQASVAAARRNARAMFLEPARAVRGPLMPGDVYDVYAMTRRSLLRSRTEESQPRCRESDIYEQQAARCHSAAIRRVYLSSEGPSPAPDAARLRIKTDRSQRESGHLRLSLLVCPLTLADRAVQLTLHQLTRNSNACGPLRAS